MSFIFNLKIDNNSLFICNYNLIMFYFGALLYFMSNKKVKQIKTLSGDNYVVNVPTRFIFEHLLCENKDK
jgi:hypothetical protein